MLRDTRKKQEMSKPEVTMKNNKNITVHQNDLPQNRRKLSIGNINYEEDKVAKIGQDLSLLAADVSPRSSPLRDVPPRETSFSGHE